MIKQIAPVSQKTSPLAAVDLDLAQARQVQAHVREKSLAADKPQTGLVSSPLTGLPYLVPILRWID